MSKCRLYGPDEHVADYRNAAIYGRDLELLERPKAWLNADCIYVGLLLLKDRIDKNKNDNTTLVLDPAVLSFLVHQCEDEEDIFDFGRGYGTAEYWRRLRRILLPIHDSMVVDSQAWTVPGAGAHWSLLLFECEPCIGEDPSFAGWHFDSVASSSNGLAANEVAQKVQQVWKLLREGSSKEATREANGTMTVVDCTVAQQENGYDCGVHVLATGQAVLETPHGDSGPSRQASWEQVVQKHFEKASKTAGSLTCYCLSLREDMAKNIRSLTKV